jgi:mRNA interferase HigB
MHIMGREVLEDFCKGFPERRKWIENWIADVERSQWTTPQDIKDRYASASFLPDRIVVFNVKGNHARLVVQIAFNTQTVFVKWAGSHAEYTRRYG